MDSSTAAESRYRWNAAGWFGGIVGSTLGLPGYAISIHERSATRAAWLMALFGVVLVLALWLWSQRSRLSARRAVFIAVPIAVAVDVIGFVIIYPFFTPDLLTGFESLEWMPSWTRFACMAAPWLIIYLIQHRRNRSRRA